MGQGQSPAVAPRVTFLDPGDRPRGKEPEELLSLKRGSVREPEGDGAGRGPRHTPRPTPGGRARPERHRGDSEDLLDRFVELPHAREAGREGDLCGTEPCRLEQDPRRLSALGPGERQRTRPYLGDQQPVEMSLAVSEPAGQSRHAVPVDDAVGDEAHRAPDRVGAAVPFR